MTDIHSHILFDVDDGSQSLDESIELLKQMAAIGFKNVILTPHYIKGSKYNSQNDEKKQKEVKSKFLGLERKIYLDYPKYNNEEYEVDVKVNVELNRKGSVRNSGKGAKN
mgnify:CR=1 FL=1